MGGVEDEVEAAALDNRNFIQVMVGNESYLSLLDPGAKISLVGSRILNKYRDRLRESNGQVRGVSGAPMKVQDNLRISINPETDRKLPAGHSFNRTSYRVNRLHSNSSCSQAPVTSNVDCSSRSGARDASRGYNREIGKRVVSCTSYIEEFRWKVPILYRFPRP